jgi:hypothetical protein
MIYLEELLAPCTAPKLENCPMLGLMTAYSVCLQVLSIFGDFLLHAQRLKYRKLYYLLFHMDMKLYFVLRAEHIEGVHEQGE